MDCGYPPLVETRENSALHRLMRTDKCLWPRCLLWHGWLPWLSGVTGGSAWAGSADEVARNLLEVFTGSCSSCLLIEWDVPEDFDVEGACKSQYLVRWERGPG